MPLITNTPVSIPITIMLTVAMVLAGIFVWFNHDAKHRDLDTWIDYGFSRETLLHALLYYRFMGLSMLVFYVLFTVSCLLLQSDGYKIFADANGPTTAGPVGTAVFAFDLVLRGGFFDFMQHFDLRVTHLQMNRAQPLFVWYAFAFRMYYGLTLIKVLFSFAWIWAKIRRVRGKEVHTGASGHERL
jgi:hypothetical protein